MVLKYKRAELKDKVLKSSVKEEATSTISDKKKHEINKLIAKLLFQND